MGFIARCPLSLRSGSAPKPFFLRGDFESYGRYSTLVTDIIEDTVPVFEKASIDEFYVDLTGFDRFFQTAKFTAELKKRV